MLSSNAIFLIDPQGFRRIRSLTTFLNAGVVIEHGRPDLSLSNVSPVSLKLDL